MWCTGWGVAGPFSLLIFPCLETQVRLVGAVLPGAVLALNFLRHGRAQLGKYHHGDRVSVAKLHAKISDIFHFKHHAVRLLKGAVADGSRDVRRESKAGDRASTVQYRHDVARRLNGFACRPQNKLVWLEVKILFCQVDVLIFELLW